MALIIIGTGLLKPNVSSVVGDLYTKEDERRDSGFSIFYMGINLGGLLAPLIVGTLGQKYNYHLGFGCAAAGMFLGLIVFALTRKKYLGKAGSNVPNPISKSSVIGTGIGVVIAAAVIIVLIQTGWLTIQRVIDTVSILGIVIPVIYFIVMFTSKSDENGKITACGLCSAVYCSGNVLGDSGAGRDDSCFICGSAHETFLCGHAS